MCSCYVHEPGKKKIWSCYVHEPGKKYLELKQSELNCELGQVTQVSLLLRARVGKKYLELKQSLNFELGKVFKL